MHHPDAIQIWSRNSARANSDVTVRGNFIRRGNGDPSQGIFVNTPETETAGLLIEENVVEQSMGQGIFVLNAVDAIVRKNTVLPVDYRVDAPGLEIRSPSRNITVSGNIASAFRLDAGVNSTGNAIVDYYNPWIAAYVGNLIAEPERLTRADGYAALTDAGARAFVRDIWSGNPNIPVRPLAHAAVVADIVFRGNVIDRAPDPLSISEVKLEGGYGYHQTEPAPKLSAALNLTIEASVSPKANGAWQLIAAVPDVFDLRLMDDRIRFSLWTIDGAVARIDTVAKTLLDPEPHDLAVVFDGLSGEITLFVDGAVAGRKSASVGPVYYLPTQRLYVGGAPWGLIFEGRIGALKIGR